MSPVSVHRLFQLGFLAAYLLLSAFISAAVSVDLSEQRNKVVRLYPRGNQWAIGHFMGKKSIPDSQILQYPEEAASVNSAPGSPALLLGDMKDMIIRELLKIPVQQRQADESQVKFDLNDRVNGLLMKILENHTQNNRK